MKVRFERMDKHLCEWAGRLTVRPDITRYGLLRGIEGPQADRLATRFAQLILTMPVRLAIVDAETQNPRPIGYAILNDHGEVSIVTDTPLLGLWRAMSIGTMALLALQSCRRDPLFARINERNTPAQRVLKRLGWWMDEPGLLQVWRWRPQRGTPVLSQDDRRGRTPVGPAR